MTQITMKLLLEAGVHFGHQTRQWNPKMGKFIFGERNRVHIIDLQKVIKELKKAFKFIRDIAAQNKAILFVGTKEQSMEIIEQEAKRCGVFFVSQRWLGGTLTNFQTIRNSVGRLKELEKMKQEGIFKLLSKKESSKKEKEINKLEQALGGIREMEHLPGVVFVIDPVEEEVVVREAKKVQIPIVAVCDTDADPDVIDYPIPGNDDAIRSIKVFCSIIADAVLEGKEMFDKSIQEQKPQELTAGMGLPQEDLVKEISFSSQKSEDTGKENK